MNPNAKTARWFNTKSQNEDTYNALFPLMEKINTNQLYRSTENMMWARLYGNTDIGLAYLNGARNNPISAGARPKFNVVASCIETLAAKISKNRPRPMFLTDGGDWTLQQKAKRLQKFTDGQFYASHTYQESDKAFIDGCAFGTGLVKVFSQHGKIVNERTIVEEILIDDAEAVFGKPRNMYQKKGVSRDFLIDAFPKFKSQINDLPSISDEWGVYLINDEADYVEVGEGWHLRSSPTAKDGRHSIVTKNATLLSEEWTRDKFPFAEFRFRRRLVGWYGQGIPELIIGTQVAINRILRNNDISQYLHSAPAWLVEDTSSVVSAHLNNDIGHIVKYKGITPELRTWAAANPEMYKQIDIHIQRAYEEVGISQLSAASAKPAGLDSGKALREYNDIESERFIKLGQQWEQFHLDIADLNIDEAKALSETDKGYAVKAKNKGFMEEIKWSDVDMERDCYLMQAFPTSSLPRSPAGRMAYVNEMSLNGWIDPDTAQELLDLPDLERYNDLRFSSRNVVRQAIEKILESNKYSPPEPFQDLEYSLPYAQMSYNYAKIHGAPEKTLELLRRYMMQVKSLQDSALPPPPPPPTMPGLPAPEMQEPQLTPLPPMVA